MEDTGHYRILVAIETDATRYHGAQAVRPALLGNQDSEQLLAHLAADLKSLLPSISRCSLIAPGALFDQTQILRPAYPVFAALESTSVAERAEEFRPGLISVAAENGAMPLDDLQPLDDIPLGLLQVLPLVLHGPAEDVSELGQAMEYRFLEEGQLSAHSAKWLETAFGIAINHARFMTLTDLNAMLRLQLDHFGFLPMWELLDAALNEQTDKLVVQTASGKALEWSNQAVHTDFESFDYWANEGAGRDMEGARQMLANGYGDWTREIRQYLTTLNAHGVRLEFHLPGVDGESLPGNYFVEYSQATPEADSAVVTQHHFEELGTIALSLVKDGRLLNYYPLSPDGLNEINTSIRRQVPVGHTVAFPGTLQYDEASRRLKPDSTPDEWPQDCR
jgi:hypothetical protein